MATDEFNDSVTCLRIELLKDAIQNLARITGCTIGSNGLNLMVSKKNKKDNHLILCGKVICSSMAKEYKQ